MKIKDQQYDWFKGVVTPLITPLTKDEMLDLNALEQLVKKQINNEIHALFVLGSVGEGPMLPNHIRNEVVKQTLILTQGKIPVLVGVMDNSITLVLEKIREVENIGVAAVVVTLPYYGWAGDTKQAINFFLTLADKSPLPIILYNLPRVVHKKITLEILEPLFGHPNIAGLKDSGINRQKMKQIVTSSKRPAEFKVLIGNSLRAAEMLLVGADGIVSVYSNLIPELLIDIYNSACSKDGERLKYLQKCIVKLQKILECPNSIGGIKCAMEILGISHRNTVSPWPQADKDDERVIKPILTEVKKIYSNLKGRRLSGN